MAFGVAEECFGDLLLLARRHLGPVSEVFLARPAERPGGPLVIVKRVLPHVRDDPRVRAEFEREAALLAGLRDPRFPRLLEAGERSGLPYLVLDFLPGPTWRQVASAVARRGRPRGWTRVVVSLGAQALEALAELHGREPSIVHGDVSPENLLVSPEGGVAVLDLGVAQVGGQGLDEPAGKLAYMSPEHRSGGALDGRADLYGLGIVLVELLSGIRPAAANGPGRVAPAAIGPRGAWHLAAWLSAPAREDRPASAGQALTAFRKRLRGLRVGDPRQAVRDVLPRLFDPSTRAAWSPEPGAWSAPIRQSAEERGEETTDRQPGRDADVTEVVEPIP